MLFDNISIRWGREGLAIYIDNIYQVPICSLVPFKWAPTSLRVIENHLWAAKFFSSSSKAFYVYEEIVNNDTNYSPLSLSYLITFANSWDSPINRFVSFGSVCSIANSLMDLEWDPRKKIQHSLYLVARAYLQMISAPAFGCFAT